MVLRFWTFAGFYEDGRMEMRERVIFQHLPLEASVTISKGCFEPIEDEL